MGRVSLVGQLGMFEKIWLRYFASMAWMFWNEPGFTVQLRKLYLKTLNAPQNVRFADLCRLAEAFGYSLHRVSGSHHLFVHPKATRPLNFQNCQGKAKSYQVKQFLRDIEEFQLSLGE